MTKYILILLAFLFVAPKNVYAYIDPGSGSYLTQIVMGFVLGGLFMLKVYWNKVKEFFWKISTKKKSNENSEK